jgi:heptaprenyl diphosphate synthase
MKRLATNGIFIALALIFSYLEKFIPVEWIIPIPGIKLGLANIVTVAALILLDAKSAATITILRCILANMLFGTPMSMIFAISGAILALTIMTVLKTGYNRIYSVIGISAAGAAAHNAGQIAAAALVMKSAAVFYYLPLLLVASLVTGFVTGIVAQTIIRRLEGMELNTNF